MKGAIETVEHEELVNVKAENEALQAKLTKRNEQYMMGLDKALTAANLSEERKTEIYSEMLPHLVEGQKTGQTARQIYGTVTEQTSALLDGPRKATAPVGQSKDWMIALDGGLMMVALLSLITGVSSLWGKAQQGAEMGIITLLINFLAGGIVILLISKNAPNRYVKEKKKGGFFRYILIIGVAMLAWMFLMTASMAFLPASINMSLPPIGYLIVAAAAFGAKLYFKRKWNIQGGFF